MEKCSCYVNNPWSDAHGFCMGTKERDICSCQGDESKCDFYPKKREKNKKMQTLDMMIEARANGKTYRADDLLYNTKLGFHDKCGNKWQGYDFDYLNTLFEINNWQMDDTIYMTKSEAEEKYGIRIVGWQY